ncbi:MAG: subclass B3 metallo-beta-lactamase, partial [Pontixanthobacter sp.]
VPSANSVAPAAMTADQAAWTATCKDWDEWDKRAPPYRIHGNTYYVGTCGISAILVASEDGLILFDSGTEPGSHIVTSNIASLGYSIADVKAHFVSHEHFDHVGGMARLQMLSGAAIYTGWGAAPVIRSGKADPRDPQAASLPSMTPVPGEVRSVRGGENARFAGTTVTAISTPGHTIGALSWQWNSCDEYGCVSIVYADSLSPVSSDGYRFSDHPELLAEYRAGLLRLAALDCDILLTPHPSASNMIGRLKGEAPLVDSGGCKAYAAAIGERLDKRLAEEGKSKNVR